MTQIDPERVAEGMMLLLQARLNDPERAAKISDTVAAKFFAEANKFAERRAQEAERAAEAPREVLDIIRASDINPERKDRIVDTEIARLEEKVMQLRVAKERRYE